jgi:hypothetical protein
MKTGRNQACPCGSGKKFKRCCGDPLAEQRFGDAATAAALARHRAKELIREQQQGLGRPIVSAVLDDHRMVAVGNELRFSDRWKVFPDFLSDHIKVTLGVDWGNAELAKPITERHPLFQWYDQFCRFERSFVKKVGEVHSAPATGVVSAYLGLAYNLYLIKHNAELHERLVKRLRDPLQFQGAYYELIVANILIRAGFQLHLEDEADDQAKHCEFFAVSKATGQKYWVEAKMRSVEGLLGKTKADGSRGKDATGQISEHVRLAFQKPAADKRLIFVDVNAPGEPGTPVPSWVERAARRLEARERDTPMEQSAYVFVTNMCFHRHLEDASCGATGMAYGLHMADFAKPGRYRLSEKYRAKQKHIDAHFIAESLETYPRLPITFDGSMPSEARAGGRGRVLIGERYFFTDVEGGILAEVTTATVSEAEKKAYIGVVTEDGRSLILSENMTDDQLADYREHRDAYFGVVQPAPRDHTGDPYSLFEAFVQTYMKSSFEKLLQFANGAPDFPQLAKLPHDDLVLELCERWVAAALFEAERGKAA